MKHILPSIISFCIVLSLPFGSVAQISLLSTDLTSIGDVVTRYTDTIPTYGPGSAGANQIWDFSDAINDTTAVTNVVAVSATPYASTFASSNYAMTGATASYLYFTHNTNTMTTTGAAGDLLGTGETILAPFSNALTLHQFPRTYGSFFNDTYAFQAEADGAAFGVYRIRVTHNGHVYDTTDGYGTLITPTGSYDALRVKSVDFTTDQIDVKLFSFAPWTAFSTVIDTSVSYTWHAKEEKLAIAEFAFDSIGNPSRFTYSAVLPVVYVGIEDGSNASSMLLYPQPAADQLCVNGLEDKAGNHTAEVFGMDGKMVLRQRMTGTCIDLQGTGSGMYILRLTMADGSHQEPMKFVVQ